MTRAEAIEMISQKIQLTAPQRQLTLTNNRWIFWVEKLVIDILDYCHRKDFPEALIYTCVDLILKRLADYEMAADNVDSDPVVVLSPLSEIKEDETSYKFDTDFAIKTTATDNVGLLSDLDFDTIKQRLNLYRKPVSF